MGLDPSLFEEAAEYISEYGWWNGVIPPPGPDSILSGNNVPACVVNSLSFAARNRSEPTEYSPAQDYLVAYLGFSGEEYAQHYTKAFLKNDSFTDYEAGKAW